MSAPNSINRRLWSESGTDFCGSDFVGQCDGGAERVAIRPPTILIIEATIECQWQEINLPAGSPSIPNFTSKTGLSRFKRATL
jgi:hypothetical protein